MRRAAYLTQHFEASPPFLQRARPGKAMEIQSGKVMNTRSGKAMYVHTIRKGGYGNTPRKGGYAQERL